MVNNFDEIPNFDNVTNLDNIGVYQMSLFQNLLGTMSPNFLVGGPAGIMLSQTTDGFKIYASDGSTLKNLEVATLTAATAVQSDSIIEKTVDNGVNVDGVILKDGLVNGIDTTTITTQGNTFNGDSELVKTDNSGKLPAIDGSQLTNMTKSQVGLSNVDNVQQLPMSYLSTDTTMGGLTPSNELVPSQEAVESFVNYSISQIPAPMHFKGAIDASLAPNYPASTAGDVYVISVSGKLGGLSGVVVNAGDQVVCTATNAGGDQATVGADFDIVEFNLLNAVTSSSTGSTSGDIAIFDGTTGNLIKDSSIASSSIVLNTTTINGHALSSDVTISASDITTGTLPNAQLTSDVTLQGNTFNGASELVKLDSSAKLPAVDGSQLTNISTSQISGGLSNSLTSAYIFVGNASNIATGVALSGDATISNTGSITIGSNVISNSKLAQAGANTYKGNATGSTANVTDIATNTAFNKNFETSVSNIMMDGTVALGSSGNVADASHVHPTDISRVSTSTTINGHALTSDVTISASDITTGTLPNAQLTSDVTLMGNTFNGDSELVKTTSSGKFPALDGSLITNLNLANITNNSATQNILIPISSFGSTASSTSIPAGSIVKSVTTIINSAFDATSTIEVDVNSVAVQPTSDIAPAYTGAYRTDSLSVVASASVVTVVASGVTAGSASVLVEYVATFQA